MKRIYIIVGIVIVAISIFLFYRWKMYGKGNKEAVFTTMFGFPLVDIQALQKEGFVLSSDGKTLKKPNDTEIIPTDKLIIPT